MIKSIKFVSVLLILISMLISCAKESQLNTQALKELKFSQLTGPYLGQKPPGDIPELFAPGIITDIYREHTATAFTPDGKEVFWTRVLNQGTSSRIDVIMHMKQKKGVWTKPELAPFCIGRASHIHSISPDGKHIYFSSNRPIDKNDTIPKVRNWVVDKTEDGWGEPRVNNLFSSKGKKFILFQETKNGNFYFQSNNLPNVEYGIGFVRAKIIDGKYQQPKALGVTINSEYLDYGFCVEPSEEFIIFSSDRPGGFTDLDLYISYRQTDDSWSEAINLGEKINTIGVDGSAFPYLSPDGKYLFFITTRQPNIDIHRKKYSYAELKEMSIRNITSYDKIYWVSTSFIDELKPEHLK
ncbi:PD40 domain-containing protein [bacterium]|nr:PD40 domain-containing protein [bacterium]